jgi:hypothetical protein
LYGEGYTIRGVQRILREQGVKFVQQVWVDGAAQPPHGARDDEEEFAEETVEEDAAPLEEAGGLRRRFASLIGRDLGDPHDDAEMRREPPLTSAPAPRIEPGDRILQPPAAQPQMPPLTGEQPAPQPAAVPARIAPDDLLKLRTALHELAECRKLIDAALLPRE